MSPKAPSTTSRINLHPNLADGTSGITKHDKLHTY
jgi:hypothetical protein